MQAKHYLNRCYEKSSLMVQREIAGEILLVPVRRNVAELQSIFTLNEVAVHIWSLIDENTTVMQIIEEVVKKYDVSRKEAEVDVVEFFQNLEELGAIQVLEGESD